MLTQPRPIRFKGRSYLALTLSPELPFEDWLMRLDDIAARSAGFFLRRPVVLDVEGLDIDKAQLRDFVERLGERQVRIMGIEGARPSLLSPDLPPAMHGGRAAGDIEEQADAPAAKTGSDAVKAAASQIRSASSIVVTEPIRSGQSLFFPDGDVTIVGSVASGAEVIAGGSIHIYGALRGRAMAGTTGQAARIFCRKLEAELVALDGYYQTAEDLDPALRGKPVQFWLEDETFKAATLA